MQNQIKKSQMIQKEQLFMFDQIKLKFKIKWQNMMKIIQNIEFWILDFKDLNEI